MNAKRACLVALVMTLAGAGAARAQYGAGRYGGSESPPPALPAPGPAPTAADAPVPPPTGPRLSDYLVGTRPDCCGPIGGDGQIGTELYVRWGPSINTAAGYFGRTLETGWEVQAGGRVLFFNPAADGAWVVDLGVSNVSNHGQHSDKIALLHDIIVADPVMVGQGTRVPAVQVSTASLNRTYVNVGFGRECYLWCPATFCSCGKVNEAVNWRAGFDVGGRYGTEKLELHEIRHRTDVIAAVYLALHTDLEIPWHSFIFQVGGRVEWDYTWMDILQDTPTDLQNINILMTLGVRY
jgi:hypothetical protein